VPGLRLRVSSRVATWNLAIRDSRGRARRFSLGRYPDKTLQNARDEARALREKVRDGADPVAERRAERAKAKTESEATLAALLNLYEKKVGYQRRSWAGAMRPAIEHVFRAALMRPVAELTRGELQLIATSHAKRHGAATAVRCLRPVLRWAAINDYAREELGHIKPPAKVQRCKRVLTRDELSRLLPALITSNKQHAKLMLFLLYSLARRDEAASARWQDIDMATGVWTIPFTKNGEPHTVPLSRQALALLRSVRPESPAPEDLVFRAPARGAHPGGKLSNWDRETRILQTISNTACWQRHDLRRTGATMLGELGTLPDIVEAPLNHISIRSPLGATYNRSRYRPQVAAALQRLADYYDGILSGGAEVRPFARSA
jgi:integrase